ncbi:MAG: hypothetical protein COW63_08615 [Bacteroidetes bacterium CG18_big_fil_WC_8_21_14_2_50_41_14]|nr:MAG: hypothetical protein COW63_08615 [Bacteroidetes bacterium CG18_big_fil_WC_8_21_14_2_50_41_14]
MKTCPNCKASYQEDDKKFCKKCGTELTTVYSIPAQEMAKKTVFEDRLKADPLNVDILHDYARFLFNNLLFKESISISLKILAINENVDDVKELLFQLYIKINRNKEAVEIGKQLLAKKPDDIVLLENLADLLNKPKDHDEALKYLDKILNLEPENTSVHYKKAIFLLHANLMQDAIAIFKKLKAEDQNDRVTLIYDAIGEALNSEYKISKDLLLPVLSTKDISLNDLDNNRGFLYLTYCLCRTNADMNEINHWLSLINIHVLKKNYSLADEQTLAKTVLFIVNNKLGAVKSFNAKIVIEDLIREKLKPIDFYFTGNTNQVISEIWYNIGTKQAEFKLYSDSVSSLKRSCDLLPDEEKFVEKYKETQNILYGNKRKRKKKVIIYSSIVSLCITSIVLIIIFTRPPKTVEKNGGLIFNLEIISANPNEKEINSTIEILRKRISSVCSHNPSVVLSPDKENIQIRLPLVHNSQVLEDFILTKGKIEIREFYDADFFRQFLNIMYLDLNNKFFFSTKENKNIFIRDFGEFLKPYTNQRIMGPIIGTSNPKDTALVSEIIKSTESSGIFPIDFEAKWILYSSGNLCALMALKVIYKDDERITSSMIHDATVKKSQGNFRYQVFIKLKPAYIDNWYNLTFNNVGKPLAFIFANKLLSFPLVNGGIKNGSFSIVFDEMTLEQANAIAATLNSGMIPIDFKIKDMISVNPKLAP